MRSADKSWEGVGFESELLPAALRRHARERPESVAVTLLGDRGAEALSYTFAELDFRARTIAAALQAEVSAGSRVVMLLRPGIDFLAAFMGTQYAGMTAVPVQPPAGVSPHAGARSLERLRGSMRRLAIIAEDAEAAAVLTTSDLDEDLARLGELVRSLETVSWIQVDRLDDSSSEEWRMPPWRSDDPSLLQYTSGSTAEPKGVTVEHRHLCANAVAMSELFGLEPAGEVCVSWLPPTHDMGLIGSMLQQVRQGSRQVLLSPMAFLKRPLTWLRALSEHRATISATPNFALDLCVDRSTAEQRRDLDLSNLRVLAVGAEPIRVASVRGFLRAFEECGLRPDAVYPCYGLAESTLVVTGRRGLRAVSFDRDELSRGRARPVADRLTDAVSLVSCGRPPGDAELLIVDPESGEASPDGMVGEIWVSSSHVAGGYYGREELSRQTFRARHDAAPGVSFLRTGDAGVVHDGELFVSGRYKDVMIFGGANYHPYDIEQTVAASDARLRSDRVVAFSIAAEGDEKLVVGVDVRSCPDEDRADLGRAIREAVFATHGLSVHTLIALKPGALTRTTSGKPQRYRARQRHLEGELGEVL